MLLGRSNVVVLLAQLVPLFLDYHASSPESGNNYLATLYESLKLLNLLAKMSQERCEQACLQGNLIAALRSLVSYVEQIDEPAADTRSRSAQRSPAQLIIRSKKNRLINTCLQLLHELVLASVATRSALLQHNMPQLLLQLFQAKSASYSSALSSQA